MAPMKREEVFLPALRGVMGDRVFYSAMMPIETVADRISYANDIHNSVGLTDMIQRTLEDGRGREIAKYLAEQDERFFNSLVIATYGGDPQWHPLGDVKPVSSGFDISRLDNRARETVGFLTLSGSEKLFAIDGQHRLAGIKSFVAQQSENEFSDMISVLFVSHQKTKKGMTRTRRLFTTLNKRARPVSKADIIALDEDDVMAITVRKLIEESELFGGKRIAFVDNNNMPDKNSESLTTIGALYDCLAILFSSDGAGDLKAKKKELESQRPSDENLESYYNLACEYFELLSTANSSLRKFFGTDDYEKVVKKFRGDFGGDAVFRPLGLKVLTEVVSALSKHHSLQESIELVGKISTDLTDGPFCGLLWDSKANRILNNNTALLKALLKYLVGLEVRDEEDLLRRYRIALDNENLELPQRES